MLGYDNFFTPIYCNGEWSLYSKKIGPPLYALLSQYLNSIENALDLASGGGDLCLYLRSKGINCLGIDISPNMVSYANSKSDQRIFQTGSMCSFDLKMTFDLITCVFNSINHITDYKDLDRMFKCVSSHLTKKGLFFFDVLAPEAVKRFNTPKFKTLEEYKCHERVWLNNDRLYTTFYKDDYETANCCLIPQKIYSYDNLTQLIQQNRLQTVWESYNLPDFNNSFLKRRFYLVGLR